MCWRSPDCLSGCKRRTARNAGGKQARAQSKPGSRAGRNNVTVRGRYAVKMSGLHPMFLPQNKGGNKNYDLMYFINLCLPDDCLTSQNRQLHIYNGRLSCYNAGDAG